MQKEIKELAARLAKQDGAKIVSANTFKDLKGVVVNFTDFVTYKVGEVLVFPNDWDLEHGQIQSKKFGNSESYYVVLPNKQVYLSTFTKNVVVYDAETKEPVEPSEVAHADNAFYNWALSQGDLYSLLEGLKGKTLKVVKVDKVCTAKYNNAGEIIGTRVTSVVSFEDITPKDLEEAKSLFLFTHTVSFNTNGMGFTYNGFLSRFDSCYRY